ncbi:Z-ring formation inhibitor MciZ [Neobacillus niacini]
MKVYVHEKGITLVGKGWEIIQKLKEYNKDYSTVSEWVEKVAPK